jgi:hypothetical protein
MLIDPVAAAGSTFRCIAVLVIYAGKLRAEARLPRVLGTHGKLELRASIYTGARFERTGRNAHAIVPHERLPI